MKKEQYGERGQHRLLDYFDGATELEDTELQPTAPSPITVGEMAICNLKLYKVVDLDLYGFCILVDVEGETIMRHQRDGALNDPFLRACARVLADQFEEY